MSDTNPRVFAVGDNVALTLEMRKALNTTYRVGRVESTGHGKMRVVWPDGTDTFLPFHCFDCVPSINGDK